MLPPGILHVQDSASQHSALDPASIGQRLFPLTQEAPAHAGAGQQVQAQHLSSEQRRGSHVSTDENLSDELNDQQLAEVAAIQVRTCSSLRSTECRCNGAVHLCIYNKACRVTR